MAPVSDGAIEYAGSEEAFTTVSCSFSSLEENVKSRLISSGAEGLILKSNESL